MCVYCCCQFGRVHPAAAPKAAHCAPQCSSHPALTPAPRLGPLHLMTVKLDWALLKGLRPLDWRMGNLDWAASDHRSLVVDAE